MFLAVGERKQGAGWRPLNWSTEMSPCQLEEMGRRESSRSGEWHGAVQKEGVYHTGDTWPMWPLDFLDLNINQNPHL